MRKVGYVTGSRADYGISRPVLNELRGSAGIDLQVLVCGMHLSEAFGHTVDEIETDGFSINARIPVLEAGDSAEDIATAIARGVEGFASFFAKTPPDILVVLGDRFEMYAAALAALPFGIPVTHVHGGELTLGAFDDALRHSMTKLSHLHFVATEDYARRVRQLGEEDWRIVVSGAPSLDNLKDVQLLNRKQLEERLELTLDDSPLLVTFHPVTLERDQMKSQIAALLTAVKSSRRQAIFTLPNADTGNQTISNAIRAFVETEPNTHVRDNLGTQRYFSLMDLAGAMVGNSSSGLIEAPSFELPVVNIGNRQAGRGRAANVIDTGYTEPEITAGIEKALAPDFCRTLSGLENPYGRGDASKIIAESLSRIPLDARLMIKNFVDYNTP